MSGYQLSGDAPANYARFAGKIMGTWTDDLIREAWCQDGDFVLDVACGTGLVASRVNRVSGSLCTVTGLDNNEGMLNVARRDTRIECHLGSAVEMPFENGTFDVILCQQGLQYVPDRPKVTQEMARVLVPGGRVALNVWGALDRQPFHAALIAAIGAFLGTEAASAFDLAFSLNTAGELRRLAADAGFDDVRVSFWHRTMRHAAPERLITGFMVTTPIAALYLALPDDRKRALVSDVAGRLESYIDDAGLAVPQENHFLTARRPA